MTKSLVKLAEQKTLPDLQYMDNETLSWIKENSPDFNSVKLKEKHIQRVIEDVKKYTPKSEWFLVQEGIYTIHGLRHIMRVIANVSHLATQRHTDDVTKRNVLVAAGLHDVRRRNDKGDEGHAERANEWFIANQKKVVDFYGVDLTTKDSEEIGLAIKMHEIPYDDISVQDGYSEFKQSVDLLKTADALDRYRQPKLKWWINDNYLKLIPTLEEKYFAYDLVIRSEENYLGTGDSVKSVLNSLENMKGKV